MTTIAPAEAFVTVSVLIEHDGDITRHNITGQPIAPGLAITPHIGHNGFSGGWTVTHTPSGHRVASARGCLSCVKAAASHLTNSAVDWTVPDREAFADLGAAEAAANAFMWDVRDCEGAICDMWAVA